MEVVAAPAQAKLNPTNSSHENGVDNDGDGNDSGNDCGDMDSMVIGINTWWGS